MTRLTRRLVFYSFILIFLLATPPTIFYAMGYSFDWQKKVLVKTGGLYLKSSPPNAKIIIDGKNNKTTPKLIPRLLPKTYKISVEKDGYFSWVKNLEVKPQLVEEARNIILFPKNISPEKVATTSLAIADFLRSPEENIKIAAAANIASSTAGWLFYQDSLFLINATNYIFYRVDLNGYIREQISKEFLPQDNYRIIAHNNQFMVLGQNGDLYLLNQASSIFEKIASQINGAVFSGDGKKIIYWNNNEIWINYLQDILIQPYKKVGDKELITRHSQKISQVIFYPNNEYLTCVVGDQIKIIELDGRDQRNVIEFISAKNPQIYFSYQDSYFYYLTEGQLFRLKLAI